MLFLTILYEGQKSEEFRIPPPPLCLRVCYSIFYSIATPTHDRYNFTEFDPNRRLKRGAKKGSAKFKSKSKFKRKK